VLLSELVEGKTEGGDWFDVLLDSDTPLFVDPFLIYKETEGRWAGAHDELIAHFDKRPQAIRKARNPRGRDFVRFVPAVRSSR
jgi:hypothetical protein